MKFKNLLHTISIIFLIPLGISAQSENRIACPVEIPDANFKATLLADTLINTNKDSEIQCTEAEAFSGAIMASGMGIYNTTGLEYFTNIVELDLSDNNIDSIDLSNNTLLTAIDISANQLSTVDVSNNTALWNFNCSFNTINVLDLSNNISLRILSAEVNDIKILDLSLNTELYIIRLSVNKLVSLNLKNGNNTAFFSPQIKFDFNPDLFCVTVDDENDENNNTWKKNSQSEFSNDCLACSVAIPDSNFKAVLLANPLINTNSDNEIQCYEAENFEGAIDASNKAISNTTGLEEFINLEYLNLNTNTISSIDLSKNTQLRSVNLNDNLLTTIDFSQNSELDNIYANNNSIDSLDLSQNLYLDSVSLIENNLTKLNLNNGTNLFFDYVNISSNPNLFCVKVDEGNHHSIYTDWYKDSHTIYSNDCNFGCFVNIPDTNFKAALIADTLININKDAEIQCYEAAAIDGILSLKDLSISDATGLESFVNLEVLNLSNNNLTSIDLSNNTALIHITLSYNNLTELDVSNNTELRILEANNNALTTVDLSENAKLNWLLLPFNQLDTLDITSNATIKIVDLTYNQLNRLDLSNNQILETLKLGVNKISSIDLSQNLALKRIELDYNNIDSLDLSNNLALETAKLNLNQINSLDLSQLSFLKSLDLKSNNLEALNLQNGNNAAFSKLDLENNPNLYCVLVDDQTDTNSFSTWDIDPQTQLLEDCSNACIEIVEIPDGNFKAILLADTLINTNRDGEIQCDEAANFTGYIRASSAGIKDVTGIEKFINTDVIYLGNNELTSIDVSKNTKITFLDVGFNQLSALDVSANVQMEILFASDNQIDSLNLSKNTSLDIVIILNNSLSQLNLKNGFNFNFEFVDVKNNPDLYCITIDDDTSVTNLDGWIKDDHTQYSNDCNYNCILTIPDSNFKAALIADTTINTNKDTSIQCYEASTFDQALNLPGAEISNATGIEAFVNVSAIDFTNNQLTDIDLSQNTKVETILLAGNEISSLDVSSNTLLTSINTFNNPIGSIDLSNNPDLNDALLMFNNLSAINLEANSKITYLNIGNNQISTLDVTNNLALTDLAAPNNNISNIYLSKHVNLEYVALSNNALSNLDLSQNSQLTSIGLDGNQLESLNIKNGNNANFTFANFKNNSNLTCITVDDETDTTTHSIWELDAQTNLSNDCSVGLDEIGHATAFNILPNPSNGLVTIEFDGTSKSQAISISTITGSLVHQSTVTTAKQQLDVSHLAKGTYNLTVINSDGVLSHKLLLIQ